MPLLGMEAEIGFRFLRDAPPRAEAYSYAEVAERVVAFPAIEIVATRYRDYKGTPLIERTADCMSNGAYVVGDDRPDWRSFDLVDIAGEPCVRRPDDRATQRRPRRGRSIEACRRPRERAPREHRGSRGTDDDHRHVHGLEFRNARPAHSRRVRTLRRGRSGRRLVETARGRQHGLPAARPCGQIPRRAVRLSAARVPADRSGIAVCTRLGGIPWQVLQE